MHSQKQQASIWLLTPIALHLRAYEGDYLGHRAHQSMPRKVLLGPYPTYSRDHGASCTLQWLAPKPRTGGACHHLDDDLRPPLFSGEPQVTPQGRAGKALPSKNCTARIRDVAVLPVPGGTRHTWPLPPSSPLPALKGTYAPPGRHAISARLPLGFHATCPSVARSPIPCSLCTGNLGNPKGPTYSRGGGHIP